MILEKVKNIVEVPNYMEKYSDILQRQYIHVFNTVFKTTRNPVRATRAANSVLKKRFTGKEQTWDKNDKDYINHLIDSFLGNLYG